MANSVQTDSSTEMNEMDNLFKGIIMSEHPQLLKQQLINRLLLTPGQSTDDEDCLSLLATAWGYSVNEDSEFVRNSGRKVFCFWSSNRNEVLKKFYTTSNLINFLSDDSILHKDTLLNLTTSSLERLRHSDNFLSLCRIVQTRCISYIAENKSLPILKAMVVLLQTLPECVPTGKFAGNLATVIVYSIADIKVPKNGKEYIMDIKNICVFLSTLWNNNTDAIDKTLYAIFSQLSVEEERKSLPALACVMEALPINLIDYVNKIISTTYPASTQQLSVAIHRMLDWLSWPVAINIDKWIISIFSSLAQAKMYVMLMNVFEATIEQVFMRLIFPFTRKATLSVLSYMLLSYQHSPILFHKIITDIPKLLKEIKREENNMEEQEILVQQTAELFYTAMYLHSGFPDLYDPVLEELKCYKAPSTAIMQENLLKYRWGNQIKYISNLNGNKITSLAKSETGLIGLVNMGNTCYVNCILQALYMTNCLRWMVLKAVPKPQEQVLLKLQEVFAYLALTQRPSYSPNKFLEVSRPLWFSLGEQQDCAEFLHFLFNKLIEERKSIIVHNTNTTSATITINSESSKIQAIKIDNTISNDLNTTTSNQSIIEDVFGGTLEITYKCTKCKNLSIQNESFRDLNLAFPVCYINDEENKENNPSHKSQHSLEDLINDYLSTEILKDNNRYFCEKCNELQEGERLVRMIKSPSHLILTLVRFSYSASTFTRRKITTHITYPLELTLPVHHEELIEYESYSLYAVVIHSGSSAERGHYYTYVRQSSIVPSNNLSQEDRTAQTCYNSSSQDKWYLFNDSSVTLSSYKSFESLPQRFPRDTAYVLFYEKRSNDKRQQNIHQNIIRKELRETIAKDNTKYLEEQEAEYKAQQSSKGLNYQNNFHKDFDDSFPPTGGCGSGGSNLPCPRFVF